MNYKLQKNTRLYVKVNNIFNQFYSNWDNESGGFLGFDEWYAEPGRNYQIGINYIFNASGKQQKPSVYLQMAFLYCGILVFSSKLKKERCLD